MYGNIDVSLLFAFHLCFFRQIIEAESNKSLDELLSIASGDAFMEFANKLQSAARSTPGVKQGWNVLEKIVDIVKDVRILQRKPMSNLNLSPEGSPISKCGRDHDDDSLRCTLLPLPPKCISNPPLYLVPQSC